ncbi:MAG: TetR/AcrR family transcriptional regulator [Pseudomonadota bacterium]
MTDPRSRARAACLEVALAFGTLDIGLREYERQTGISARMLVHHFGDKEGLRAALLEEVETKLRDEVEEALHNGQRVVSDIARAFAAADRLPLRRLLRIALHDALGGHVGTRMVLAKERERWREMLASVVPEDEVEDTLFALVGAAVDTLLGDDP